MPTLSGRRFFFATKADLAPGLPAIEQTEAVEFVRHEMRDDKTFEVIRALSVHPTLGLTSADSVQSSPRYLIFPRGGTPHPREIPQRGGGVKYIVEPTADCLILICGGSHAATGALLAGELQQSLHANFNARDLFRRVARDLLRGFTRVQLYWVGPEALGGLRAGRRLVTIGLGSPRTYDLAESEPH